ncbi:RGS domain-containing serine/threonine-protein kinase A [Mizuhopecten yessoensis]|uniref:RGS domain-containing serine/threonine-protein kinase A n=1 Tax=Mizuhopecten yessoensis TaxID=6573 RepID=A0A210PGE9_MIZYE|nr:RGS domain-containing serine/threonine-protein kinase A [Mizuhopecten yessoensis]
MSSLRQRLEEQEQPYRDCYDLYKDTLSTITDQPENFNTITLTMLKNQINDQSVNTIKEAIQKRMLDLKSSAALCPPGPRRDSPVWSENPTGAALCPPEPRRDSPVWSENPTGAALCPPGPRRDSPVWSENSTGAANDVDLSDSMLSTDTSFDFSPVTSSFDSANVSPNLAPSKSRTLRVLIAGDINAGKTSVLNLFLGDEYLPVSSTKCTTVPCEVHNSTERYALVYYQDGTQNEEIKLPLNNRDYRWEAVRKLVYSGELNGKPVRRLLLFWPLRFFDASDPHETTPKRIADDESCYGNAEPLPIVFLDLPGLSDNEFGVSKILENIPNFHLFIFLIDIGGEPVRKTFENMLENVKKEITRHGIDFNPESALFLLNRSDLHRPAPCEELVENAVLSAIQPKWPMVGEEQLHRLSCTKIKSGEESMEPFKRKIRDFMEAAHRVNLEEHYLWLINLLEVINAFFDTSVNWLPYNMSLQKIKDYAEQDNGFLEKELGIIEDKNSSFYKHIMEEAKKSQGKLREHIKQQIGGSTTDLAQRLRSVTKDKEEQTIREDFDSELKTFLDQHRTRLKKNVKLVECLEQQCQQTLNMNDVLNTIATLVTIPLASIFLFGRSLTEEIEIAVSDPINHKISQRTEYFFQQAQAAIEQETNFIISQQQIRQEILSFEFKQNRSREERKLRVTGEEGQRVIHGVSATVDVVQVTNNSSTKVLARKRVKSVLHNGGPMLTCLPQNHNVYRELVIMRSLSRKDSKNCVMFRGSSSWIEGGEQILAILMDKADKNLDEVIMDLERSQIGWEKRLQFALGAARGLEYLHRNGYIHQEVKPRHFLVYRNQDSGEDIVKICDFGHVKEEFVPVTTASDQRNAAYYAPELFGQAARHSTMSDVYSLGLVIWELWHCRKITCNPGEPPSIREVSKGEFKAVIKSCLEVQPNKRPNSRKVVQILSSLVGSQ